MQWSPVHLDHVIHVPDRGKFLSHVDLECAVVTSICLIHSLRHASRDHFTLCPRIKLWPAYCGMQEDDQGRCGMAAYGSVYFHFVPNITMADPLSLIDRIHERRMKAGVAISPDTPSTAISDEVAQAADMLLVMTVYPGRGGQKFLDRCVPKVAELRARFPDKDIEVDGGVGPKTIDVCADAGSNVIVAGTAIFNAPDPEEVIALLKSTVETAQAKIAGKRA
ncbi:Ribulose-phosphate 3-epimerase [Grifola frondosa]|uniref:Ribulose-phosphate 3-epimerase n=1 Tax=Grifola frondosa TaxID=5627 RepID=A0A1C7MS21_GRIFR|nr:Ribulose-phosphate 3-epimerase [Grifola frondosa]